MYECVICHSLASLARHHCPVCGAIRPMYSMLPGKPSRFIWSDIIGHYETIEVTVAQGCARQNQHQTVRAELKTVELSYYAEGE